MKTITMQDLKKSGAKSISGDSAVYLIVNSKPKCVMVPIKEYEMYLAALEELEDMKTIEERTDEDTIAMEEIVHEFE